MNKRIAKKIVKRFVLPHGWFASRHRGRVARAMRKLGLRILCWKHLRWVRPMIVELVLTVTEISLQTRTFTVKRTAYLLKGQE